MKLQAVGNNVVLKVLKRELRKGSIMLPDSQSDESDFCEVVGVGPHVVMFEVGDMVLKPTAEYEWQNEDEDDQVYLVLCEAGIVAKVVK